MVLQQFINKWTGNPCDFDGVAGAQCVDLYRMYVKESLNFPQSAALGINGKASDIWKTYLLQYFERIENTPDGVPKEGDIVIWNDKAGGGYGHVAVFVEGTAKSFRSFDQNWPVGSPPHIQGHYYTSVLGWLRPKITPKEDSVSKLLEYMGVKDQEEGMRVWDQETAFLKQARQEALELETELETQRNAYETLRKTIQELREKLANIFHCRAEDPEILAEAAQAVSYEDKAVQLEKKLETERKQYDESLGKLYEEIVGLKKELEAKNRQLEALEKRVDELAGAVPQITPQQFDSIVKKVLEWIKRKLNG